jgi:hypothetical protein
MGTFCNGFTESYYVLLQEYPSLSTSCHSVHTSYAYSSITLIHSVNVYTQTLKFRGYIFVKAYALTGIEPNLTHILLDCTILYFTRTHI